MNNDFVADILRATNTLRAGDSSGATAIIQAALAAGGLSPSSSSSKSAASGFGMPPRAEPHTIEGTLAPDGPNEAGGNVYSIDAARGQRLRQPLGDVIRTLGQGRKGLGLDGKLPGFGLKSRTPDLPVPEGAELRDLYFSCAAGSRRYRLYVPASAGEGLEGLIVMLHGCTQNPEDFAAGTGMNALAEEHRLLVVYPAQTNGDNSMSCWNWFRPGDQMRDAGEPAIIAGMTTSIRDEFRVRHDRVYVAGLSAGGAMAAIMGETYPELYAGIGVIPGSPTARPTTSCPHSVRCAGRRRANPVAAPPRMQHLASSSSMAAPTPRFTRPMLTGSSRAKLEYKGKPDDPPTPRRAARVATARR